MKAPRFLALAASLSAALVAPAANPPGPAVRLTVDCTATGTVVAPTMFGVFFEDINYGADGGLYAELVENRSFEDRDPLWAWTKVARGAEGDIAVADTAPVHPNNPRFLRLTVRSPGGLFGIANTGFGGIPLKRGERYWFEVRARSVAGYAGPVAARLEGAKGELLGACEVGPVGPDWRRFEGVVTAAATATDARLVVSLPGPGEVDLDVVSLFPENTWKRRRNGLRADLVQMLASLKPGFVRFPGGCIVEGKDLANAYRWKDTIGDIAERKTNWNRWQNALRGVEFPHYYQTGGLGFLEYFLLCEDLGAEPVPVLNCGMSCQYQDSQLVPLEELDPHVQDALDLVEFANGPPTSPWGAKRAALGHPEPFRLRILGIGNEQWGEPYFERYAVFHRALKARHPGLQLVTTAGPGVDDQWWRLAWGKFSAGTPADLVDEHYYRPPRWFLDNFDRYDRQARTGAKVFAGEYAAHDGAGKRNTLRAAVAEGAFITGLLRNCDLVTMSSYAPLFAKVGSTQWAPDLIWFDNTRVHGTPSYFVQALFSRNRPDRALPVAVSALLPPADETPAGRVGLGTVQASAEFKLLTVAGGGNRLFTSDFREGAPSGFAVVSGDWATGDGVLRQADAAIADALATVGDPGWTGYTLSVKVRKLAGQEGPVVWFERDGRGPGGRWNLGGRGATQSELVVGDLADRRPFAMETGRWYDLRVEAGPATVKCHLDGRLLHEVSRRPLSPLYAAAGVDEGEGEIVVFVANPHPGPVSTALDFAGAKGPRGTVRGAVLTGDSPDAENTLEKPAGVATREFTVAPGGPQWTHEFPAHSVTVLRVPVR